MLGDEVPFWCIFHAETVGQLPQPNPPQEGLGKGAVIINRLGIAAIRGTKILVHGNGGG